MPLDLLSTRMQVCRSAPSQLRLGLFLDMGPSSIYAPDLHVHLCTFHLFNLFTPFPCLLLRMICLHVCCCELSVTRNLKTQTSTSGSLLGIFLEVWSTKGLRGFYSGWTACNTLHYMPFLSILFGSPCCVRDVSLSSACDVITRSLGRKIIRPGAGAKACHSDSSVRTLEGTHKSQSRYGHLVHTANIGMRPCCKGLQERHIA